MRVRGRQQHFWPLTVNRVNVCTATVHSKHSCLAISEAKGWAPTIVAPLPAVDRWNYIIKDLSVTASSDRMSAVCAELFCERLIRRPAVGQLRVLRTGRYGPFPARRCAPRPCVPEL